MEDWSPRERAMYDALKADPRDFDRKFEEYLALVKVEEEAPASSTTRSPSSMSVPSNAVLANPTPTSATSLPRVSALEINPVTNAPVTCSVICLGADTNSLLTVSASTATSVADDDDISAASPSTGSLVCLHANIGTAVSAAPSMCGPMVVSQDSTATPVQASPASHDVNITLPTSCSAMGPSPGNDTVAPILVLAALDIVDMAMAKQHNDSVEDDGSVRNKDITLMQQVIAVCEFSSFQAHQFLPCEVPKTAVALACLPLLQWDEKRVWPPPFSLNVLALGLQWYRQQNKCSLLELVMSGELLVARGSTVFHCSFVHQETIHCSFAIDELQRGVIAALHQKKPWPSWEACSGLYIVDGEHKTEPVIACMIFATHIEEDIESDCKTLNRCCPNILDAASVDGISFLLLESVVKLPTLREKLQKYFIILVDLEPWPSWELPLMIVTLASAIPDTLSL